MLLSKDEIKTKAKLWLRANKDWLKEQKGNFILMHYAAHVMLLK